MIHYDTCGAILGFPYLGKLPYPDIPYTPNTDLNAVVSIWFSIVPIHSQYRLSALPGPVSCRESSRPAMLGTESQKGKIKINRV